MLFAHIRFIRRNGFSPLGEGKRERKRRSFSRTCAPFSIGDQLYLRRLNAALCLPERRELRLPSVNMSARIFHSRRGGGTPLSRHFRGAVTSRFDTFTPVASHKLCLPLAIARLSSASTEKPGLRTCLRCSRIAATPGKLYGENLNPIKHLINFIPTWRDLVFSPRGKMGPRRCFRGKLA